MDKVTQELTADEIFDRPANLFTPRLSRPCPTAADVALEAMQRIEDLERERDAYRELLQMALARLGTLTETCRRQREWNKDLVATAGIAMREAA
jgi:hypothetical protein